MNITASNNEWQALLSLLNIGMRAGAYDLAAVKALAQWTDKIETAANVAAGATASESQDRKAEAG